VTREGFTRGPAPDGDVDLRHHGDADLAPGLVDLAVNVRRPAPPPWLRQVLVGALDDLAAYPDAAAATSAVAARHGLDERRALVTSGAAEAFTLLARALRPGVEVRRAVVVHPQFTVPEEALRCAGHRVTRVLLRPEEAFALAPGAVPRDADLVVIGNPTNPTSVLHPPDVLTDLARPGRVLCVDEAFLDAVPGEPGSLAGAAGLPGLVVVRSLTKTWGIAGLRAGYAVGDPHVVARMRAVQPPWAVSSLALAATVACCTRQAREEAGEQAQRGMAEITALVAGLRALADAGLDVDVPVPPSAPFVLVRVGAGEARRLAMRARGWAVRSGASFPGLGPDWWRLAARDAGTTGAFLAGLAGVLAADRPDT
jgi:histidinol-phosphate aminotransferase